jgi:hypothetical protein
MMAQRSWRDPRALGGLLFVALFISGLILGGALSSAPFPMPGASPQEVARYYGENRTAALLGGSLQVLWSLALLVFASSVTAFVRRTAGGRGALPALTSGGGLSAAALLLASALLGFVLALASGGVGLDLVGVLRQMNFLTGGTLHVATLGLFVGAASIAARRAKALPSWISRLGIVAAALAILSLASLFWFPATFLIPLGRLLLAIWCIAAGLVLAFGRQRHTSVGG